MLSEDPAGGMSLALAGRGRTLSAYLHQPGTRTAVSRVWATAALIRHERRFLCCVVLPVPSVSPRLRDQLRSCPWFLRVPCAARRKEALLLPVLLLASRLRPVWSGFPAATMETVPTVTEGGMCVAFSRCQVWGRESLHFTHSKFPLRGETSHSTWGAGERRDTALKHSSETRAANEFKPSFCH